MSAGILLYRRVGARLEVLLAHPGGPVFTKRDAGHWTIPKGEPGPDEPLLVVARREFAEETGTELDGDLDVIELGSITQKGGKVVHAWAIEGDLDPATPGRTSSSCNGLHDRVSCADIPEIDRVAWYRAGSGTSPDQGDPDPADRPARGRAPRYLTSATTLTRMRVGWAPAATSEP